MRRGGEAFSPPNIHTYSPPPHPRITTTSLPPQFCHPDPENPPTHTSIRTPPDVPGREGAEKPNQIFKSTVPRALPLPPPPLLLLFFFFFFFVSSHET